MKVVFISDTHGNHRDMLHKPPKCDLLVAVGDVTKFGSRAELTDFIGWAKEFAPRGIIVAGNHDACFEKYTHECRQICNHFGFAYLEDESIDVEGVHFYGSPWTPEFGNWHFMLPRNGGELKEVWSRVPVGVDVLLTHGPRYGVLDYSPYSNDSQGCKVLKTAVERRIRPKYHIFGHMHHDYGFVENRYSGITSYNVAICDESYNPCRKPLVLELSKG